MSGSSILVMDCPKEVDGSERHCKRDKTGINASKNVDHPSLVN